MSARAPHFERWLSDAAIEEATPRILKLAAAMGVTTSYEPPPRILKGGKSTDRRGRHETCIEAVIAFSPCATAPDGSIRCCEHAAECKAQRMACQAFVQFCSSTAMPSPTAKYLKADRTPSRRRYRDTFPTEE